VYVCVCVCVCVCTCVCTCALAFVEVWKHLGLGAWFVVCGVWRAPDLLLARFRQLRVSLVRLVFNHELHLLEIKFFQHPVTQTMVEDA